MPSPPPRDSRTGLRRTVLGTAVGALLLLVPPVAAQQPPDQVPTTGFSLYVDAIAGAVVTLLIGGGLIALAPEYTERTTGRVLRQPGETFLYGLGIFVVAFVLVLLLAITIVGIVLVIPIVIALAIVGELGYLAAGRAVADDWGPVLLVAVVVAAFASGVPLLGGLVGFVLASMGVGAWYLDYRDDGGSGSAGGSAGIDQTPGGTAGRTTTAGDVTEERGSDRTARETAGPADGDATAGTDDADADGADTADSGGDPGDEWTAGFDEDRS